jgi:hypothetical protein
VACSPASAIHVTGPGALHRTAAGSGLIEAEFPIEPFAEHYCRITVVGQDGGRAWSNPIFFD